MYQLKKLNIGSVAIYSFILIFVLSLIIMLPIGLFSMLISNLGSNAFAPRHLFMPLGAIFYLMFPVFYAIIGTVFNVILALVYNLVSGPLGGIKFNLEKIGEITEITDQV